MAMAGPDQEVDQFETVILDGTRSRDNVAITVFTWTIFTSTTEIVLDGSIARYAFEIPGVFGVELNVTDAAGNWAIDSLEVNVTDITPPVARVGEDITTGQGQIVTFDGSGSSDNVGIVNFSWSFDPQGKAETLFGMTPSFQFEPVGVFPVTLVVRDEAGNQATTVLLVTVTDTTDPVANAGDDLNITEGTLVHLDGSASVDNVGVVNWTWEFEYDDGIVTLFSPTSSFRFDIPGNYTVSLKVFDRVGNSGSDTMQILVNRIPGGGPDSGPGDDEGPDENDLCFLFLLIILVISAAMAWSLYKRNRGWIRKKPHEKAEKD